jgi:NMD protein affecting ribosome stability and mRNA decay
MTESRHCLRCGTEIPVDGPAGLCPNCLFQLALDSGFAELGRHIAHRQNAVALISRPHLDG